MHLLVHPTGLTLYFAGFFLISFFYFGSKYPSSRARSRETFIHDGEYVQYYNSGPKVQGPSQKKISDQKSVKFGAISDDFRL